jgi:hypothetical protein
LNEHVSNDDLPPDPFGPMSPLPSNEVPVARPKAIDSAFQAILAGLVISTLASVFLILLDKPMLTSLVKDIMTEVPPEQRASVPSMVRAFQAIVGITIAIFAGVFVLFAVKMRAGRNWARLVLTIYVATNAISFLTSMASSGADLVLMWSLAEVAFGVTAVVYMFRPESTKYFADYKERRLRARQRP